MIVYQLRCAAEHEFEAWFRDGAAFDAQSAAREIACPHCGDTGIEKAPMAPRLARRREAEAAPGPTPAQVKQAVMELRRQVEAHCEYVGARFAEEARRIHYGESKRRGIYGEANEADAKSLAEEGIEFSRIPWPARTDA
ncbi:MAG TPA: DUF1178 family protein [Stellaceae bacterium]|nr:DUF1178 family protein [Stellaceae bacterium]